MNATILSDNEKHYPVLLNEILSIISPQSGGTFIDCTFGQGGYSKAILNYPNTKILALDRDPASNKFAEELKNKNKNRFIFHNLRFGDLDKLELKNEEIRAIIFDLGFSYSQIKDYKRGLSFKSEGSLDMRMGLNDFSALEVVNNLDQKDLELIFKFFGEERDSKKIVKNIVRERKIKIIDTQKLVKIINSSKKKIIKKPITQQKFFKHLEFLLIKKYPS